MKNIYIVISQTGSILSSLLKVITGKEYNHASISVDENLKEMYSFGRKYVYNPFIGVFNVEHIDEGVYKRFKNTKCKVIALQVTEHQYNLMCSRIEEMVNDKDKYKYNVAGLFLAAVNINLSSEYRFYCSEFVKHILDVGNVDVSMIPDIVHPVNFLDMNGYEVTYEGLLCDYSKQHVLVKKM